MTRPAVARRGDPETSWEAARSVTPGLRTSQQEVLGLYRYGPMTDEELLVQAVRMGTRQSPSGLRTRRRELVDAGLLRDSGKTAVGRTGRRMVLWERVERPTDVQTPLGL